MQFSCVHIAKCSNVNGHGVFSSSVCLRYYQFAAIESPRQSSGLSAPHCCTCVQTGRKSSPLHTHTRTRFVIIARTHNSDTHQSAPSYAQTSRANIIIAPSSTLLLPLPPSSSLLLSSPHTHNIRSSSSSNYPPQQQKSGTQHRCFEQCVFHRRSIVVISSTPSVLAATGPSSIHSVRLGSAASAFPIRATRVCTHNPHAHSHSHAAQIECGASARVYSRFPRARLAKNHICPRTQTRDGAETRITGGGEPCAVRAWLWRSVRCV